MEVRLPEQGAKAGDDENSYLLNNHLSSNLLSQHHLFNSHLFTHHLSNSHPFSSHRNRCHLSRSHHSKGYLNGVVYPKAIRPQVQKITSNEDPWSLLEDLRNGERLSSADFCARVEKFQYLFDREWNLRERHLDGTLKRAFTEKREKQIGYSTLKRCNRILTDYEFYHLWMCWWERLEPQFELRRYQRRRLSVR